MSANYQTKILCISIMLSIGMVSPSISADIGANSFADQYIFYEIGGGIDLNDPDSQIYTQPLNSLDVHNGAAVSLGHGGQLIVKFTDNYLVGSGNSDPDLTIYEIGPKPWSCTASR